MSILAAFGAVLTLPWMYLILCALIALPLTGVVLWTRKRQN